MENSTISGNKRVASALAFLLTGVAVVAAVGFTLHKVSADPQHKTYATVNGTAEVNGKTVPHAFISTYVWPDPGVADFNKVAHVQKRDWPFYSDTHLVLPAHTLITMTLKVYDGGEELNNNFFAKVVGTVDGTMTVDGVTMKEVDPKKVQHTFTLHGVPSTSQDPLFVNVPLMKVEDADMETNGSHTVVFSFMTEGAGDYVWNCEYPCGDGTYSKFGAAMSFGGYMSGKVTVING